MAEQNYSNINFSNDDNQQYNDDKQQYGTVKFFNDEKGFGFISCDEGPDVFVHQSKINMPGRRTLADGQRVKFNVVQGQKGLQAEEVTPLGAAADAA